MAETAVSMLPWPEIITTGRSGCCCLTMSSTCSPSSRLPCSQMSRKTRCGRRASIAASASSEVPAVRVRWPSSSRMPDDELADVGLVVDDQNVGAHAPALRRSPAAAKSAARSCFAAGLRAENHMRTSPPRPAGLSRSSMPPPCSSRILRDDREAEPGAALARRHVGLEQALAALGREALAVVGDLDHDVVVLAPDARPGSSPVAALLLGHGGDRLGRVLDDVGHRLRDQPAVEIGRRRASRQLVGEGDLGMGDPHHEEHVPDGLDDVLAARSSASACGRRTRTRRPCA